MRAVKFDEAVVTSQMQVERQVFLDWIRLLCLVLLFVFHVARIFDGLGFYVEASEPSSFALTFGRFTLPWHMPLLFVISGAVTAMMLKRKDPGSFLKERMKRLAIPLIAGPPLLAYPQTIFAIKFRNPDLTWHEAIIRSAAEFLKVTDLTGFRGGFTPAHLWFLFALILLTLASMAWIKLQPQLPPTEPTTCNVTSVMPILVLIGSAGLISSLGVGGPFNPLLFGLYFFLGYSLAGVNFSGPIFLNLRFLHFAMAATLAALTGMLWQESLNVHLRLFVSGTYGMTFVLWALSFAKAKLNAPVASLKPLNEAVMPIYLLHQLVIVAVAYFVVGEISDLAAYVTILVASSALTIALYAGLVRNSNVVRWLFGMNPIKA